MKRLETLIDELREALKDATYEALGDNLKASYASVDTNDGYIEAAVPKNTDIVTIYVFHNNDSENECPNLCTYLAEQLGGEAFWHGAEIEMEEQSEADDGLDPAFSSWEDYYNYRYH